jgi:hypothetical protein
MLYVGWLTARRARMSELFFSSSQLEQSTVSLTRKARRCCGREKAYTTFFYIHWRESFSLVGGSFLSVSSSESTFLQNCHNGREEQLIRGILLGAALGLLTAVCFTVVSGHSTPTRTIQISFAFLPVYCAVWCGGYSCLRAKRV